MAMWFLFIIAPSLASAEPSPAIRGADNSDVLKELGVDIQNDGKHEKESVWSVIAKVQFCLNSKPWAKKKAILHESTFES